jgi:hypothetical protein
MSFALPPRYHTVTLTSVRRYLNVTSRYLKKMLDTSVLERPLTERPIASHLCSVPGVQDCSNVLINLHFLILMNALERLKTLWIKLSKPYLIELFSC